MKTFIKKPYIKVGTNTILLLLLSITSCKPNRPKIDFKEVNKNFQISKDESWVGIFEFKNSGTKDLYINSVNAECGVTIKKFPKSAIPPGGLDSIVIIFNGSEVGSAHKSILLETNTKEILVPLFIRGIVN